MGNLPAVVGIPRVVGRMPRVVGRMARTAGRILVVDIPQAVGSPRVGAGILAGVVDTPRPRKESTLVEVHRSSWAVT